MTPNIYAMMPTIPSHAKFLPAAQASFAKQVFPKDWRVTLSIDDDPSPYCTLGAKLNRMISRTVALGCTHIILVDSDDVHSPHRVRAQIEVLIDNPNFSCSGTSVIVYVKPNSEVWRYSGTTALWIGGLAFPINSWQKHLFPDKTSGTDTDWQHKFSLETRYDLRDESLMLCNIHSANSATKQTTGAMWTKLSELPSSLR